VCCPDGVDHKCFFRKRAPRGLSKAVHESPNRVDDPYLWIEDLEGLLSLVQFNTLEIHTWGCRVDRLDLPARMVIDLDPDESLPFSAVVNAALAFHERLDGLGLANFVKTTGGKGLHVFVPLARRHDWATVQQFAHKLAQGVDADHPGTLVFTPAKAKRRGKIFVDIRNNRSMTVVAPYSTRANAVASVSAPITWEELSRLRSSDQYTVQNLLQRLSSLKRDPWEGFEECGQRLPYRTSER
jgi:bifunctional non-homologous end joining protein LigD